MPHNTVLCNIYATISQKIFGFSRCLLRLLPNTNALLRLSTIIGSGYLSGSFLYGMTSGFSSIGIGIIVT